jgi:xanthine dehydrogenase accessory factor
MSESSASAQIALEIVRAARSGASISVATLITAPADSPLAPGSKLLLRADGTRLGGFGGSQLEEAVIEDALAALTQIPRTPTQSLYYLAEGERIHRLEAKEAAAYEVMIEVIEAPATLLIVGGGHIGLSLATIAAHVGFSVAVADDREMYANAERFPMADKTMAGDIAAHLDGFPINSNTYIVMVSRGHKVDELALRQVVTRGAAYVGMIGSKRRVSTVLRHLAEEGYPIEALEAVYTPIGLNIGAETPEEIAVSIMAEIIMVRRGGKGGQMREGRPSIRLGAVEAS